MTDPATQLTELIARANRDHDEIVRIQKRLKLRLKRAEQIHSFGTYITRRQLQMMYHDLWRAKCLEDQNAARKLTINTLAAGGSFNE